MGFPGLLNKCTTQKRQRTEKEGSGPNENGKGEQEGWETEPEADKENQEQAPQRPPMERTVLCVPKFSYTHTTEISGVISLLNFLGPNLTKLLRRVQEKLHKDQNTHGWILF